MPEFPPVGFQADPFDLAAKYWPHVRFYDRQKEIVYSLLANRRTFVPAAQKMGKDFVFGFFVVYFVLSRHPVRVVTTSAKDDHLSVLWGEISNFVNTSKVPLRLRDGGPLRLLDRAIYKLDPWTNRECDISYSKGMVASPDSIAAMGGHHVANTGDGIPRTAFLMDECSSVPDAYLTTAQPWANVVGGIGNTWPCDNFFKHALEGKPGTDDRGGDLIDPTDPTGRRYFRKVFHIRAEDSPNVVRGFEREAAGLPDDGRVVIPGVKTFAEYKLDRLTLPPDEAAVILDAVFYSGREVKVFPRELLDRAEAFGLRLARGEVRDPETGFPVPTARRPEGLGCDAAEGGDSTSFAAVDRYGILALESHKTPDTNRIPYLATDFAHKHGVSKLEARIFKFDRGGGGKQHVDRMRSWGWDVGTVGFGEAPARQPKRGRVLHPEAVDEKETRYEYLNRRAEMYWDLAFLFSSPEGFGLPRELAAVLRPQLEPLPKLFDGEGRLYLPPKNRRPGSDPNKKVKTVVELVGHSPDESDALVLAVYGMIESKRRPKAGGF